MIRKLCIAVVIVAALSPAAPSSAATHPSDVIVSMIDTGVYPWHQEFDYRGKDSKDDQFVAWWDFSDQWNGPQNPQPGQIWDTRFDDPFDSEGHGTATAAIAVGRNIAWWADRSYAPGFKLAVAKVGGWNGITGSIAEAIRWSVDTVHANVINISIGSQIPAVAADAADVYEALRYARRAGVLVVVANGNGYLNAGTVPGDPGWANHFSSSTDVLSVGASGDQGALVSTDPEVAARYDVFTACDWYESCYDYISGTSFASPTVAGMAATAMQIALDNKHYVSVDWIERLLKYSAIDTNLPPTFEGYGVLDDQAFWGNVVEGARTGRLPVRPTPDINQAYVDSVGATLRDTWSNKITRTFTPLAPSTSGQSEIGTSAPALCDAELYTITLAPGEAVWVDMWFSSAADDVDIRLYPLNGPLDDSRVVAKSTHGAGANEYFSYTSPRGGQYVVFASGWAVAAPLHINLESWTSSTSSGLHFLSQGMYASTLPT